MQSVKIESVFEEIEMGKLLAGSIFLWGGHMYVVQKKDEETGLEQATRVAGYWTNNPDDRWILSRRDERTLKSKEILDTNSENFNPLCRVWWMRHNPSNPK